MDAAFEEVITTLEKIRWLLREGVRWLKPERRSSGAMMFYKKATLEFHPVGVMGAIVPWNYPFHNVFNPLVANVFAGNALVVKVSEHASWSVNITVGAIKACLKAKGAAGGFGTNRYRLRRSRRSDRKWWMPKSRFRRVNDCGEVGHEICRENVNAGRFRVGR